MIAKKLSDEEVWLRGFEAAVAKVPLFQGWNCMRNDQIREAADNADTILEQFKDRFRNEDE